jgi:translin
LELSELAGSLRDRFDAKTSARERSLAGSRETVRACGNAIRALHRYEIESASALLSDAQSHLDAARQVLAGHDDMMHAGFVHDAEKELAEARITFALVTDAPFPSPDELGLSPAAFLKGMAEAIGELRRHILDLMRRGDLQRCEELLGAMDDMYYLLVSMDYPDGITFGLRRLTDIARSIIERTRGDFTTSSIQRSLRDVLEEHAAQIKGKGPPPPPG